MTAWESAITARSPYLWYKFEGTGVPTNYGSTSTTLTLNGTAPTYSVASLADYAYNFNSVCDYSLSTWSSVLNGNSWTIEAVVKGTNASPGAIKQIISFYSSTTSYLSLGIDTTQKLRLEYNNGSTGNVNFVSTEGINGGAWHHIALTYNSSTTQLKVYLNGRLIQTRTVNLNAMNLDGMPRNIAGSASGTTARWHGQIDELAIVPGVLSDTDIQTDSDTLGFKYRRTVFNSGTTLNGFFPLDAAGSSSQVNEGVGTTTQLQFGAGVTRSQAGKTGISSQYGWAVAASSTGYFNLNCGSPNLSDRVFSFEFWIKSSAFVSGSDQYIMYNTGTDYVHAYARPTSGGSAKLVARTQYTNGTSTEVDTGIVINDGAWHHVVVTHDGTTTTAQVLKVFLDGVEYSSGAQSRGLMTGFSGLQYFGSNTNQTLAATYDDVAFYAGLLSATDAVAHYSASIAATNGGYTAQAMVTSTPHAVFVDPVVTAELGNFDGGYTAQPMNVDATITDVTLSTQINATHNAAPLTASGELVDPRLAYLHIRTQYREDRPTTIAPNVRYVMVNQNAANTNHYDTYYTQYPLITKNGAHRLYWKFDDSNLTASDIYKAEIRLINDEASSQTVDFEFYRTTGAWTLETITHNNQPASTAVQNDGIDYVLPSGGSPQYIDITTLVQNLATNSDTGFFMHLASTSTDISLDLRGFEFEFRIWTYTEPTNDSNADTVKTASALLVDPVIAAGIDANISGTPLTASALAVNPAVAAQRNLSLSQTPLTANAEFPDALVNTSSDVSLAWGSTATASAELVNPAISVVFNLIATATPLEASGSLVEPSLSTGNTQNVGPATASVTEVAPTIQTSVNFIPDPMYVTNAQIIDPELTIVAVKEITADPMDAEANSPFGTLTVSTSVDIIANACIVDANMPSAAARVDEFDTATVLTATAEMVNPSVLVDQSINVTTTTLTATANFETVFIYTQAGVEVAADVMDPSAEMVGPIVGIWDGYAAEPMTATALMKGAAKLILNGEDSYTTFPWEKISIWNLHAESALYSSNAASTALDGIDFISEVATSGPGSRPAYTVSRQTVPVLTTTSTSLFYTLHDIDNALNSEMMPIVGAGTLQYAAKHTGAEYILKTTKPNQTLSYGTAYNQSLNTVNRLHIRMEGGYPVWEYTQQNLTTKEVNVYKYTSTVRIDDGNWHHLILQTTDGNNVFRFDYSDAYNTTGTGVAAAEAINESVNSVVTTEAIPAVEIYVDGQIALRSRFNVDLTKHYIPRPYYFGQKFKSWIMDQDAGGALLRTLAMPSKNDDLFSGSISGLAFRSTTDVTSLDEFGNMKYHAAVSPNRAQQLSQYALETYLLPAQPMTATAEMVNPTISTNGKNVLRIYFNANNATNEMFGVNTDMANVVTFSALNKTTNNPNHLFNADAAFAGGAADPDAASTESVDDAYRTYDGYRRFINLDEDVFPSVPNIDAIILMDYPEDGDEIDNLMPGYDKLYVRNRFEQFINHIRNVVDTNGTSLYISSSKMAYDFGIVSAVQEVSQNIETSVSPSDPFGDSLKDTFYDNVRNNKYRIVATESGLTDIPSYVMTDVISHTGEISDDYHIKYTNRPNGLQYADQMIIPSLPIAQIQNVRDAAGDTSNRIGENTLEVFNPSDILAGTILAKLGNTDYVTTIILKPGDILKGSPLGGKIVVNCVEDGLAMGLEEYNYANIQVVSVNDVNENAQTIQWQYSTSRTKHRLDSGTTVLAPNLYGQTYPSNGGGGGVVQAPTHSSGGNIRAKYDAANNTFTSGIYYDESSEIYALDRIPVFSMTYRAMNWLLKESLVAGEYVGGASMTAQAEMTAPTVVGVIVDPLPAVNKTINATPLTAQAALRTNIDALYGNANTIVLTLHHQDVITLYIEQEKL